LLSLREFYTATRRSRQSYLMHEEHSYDDSGKLMVRHGVAGPVVYSMSYQKALLYRDSRAVDFVLPFTTGTEAVAAAGPSSCLASSNEDATALEIRAAYRNIIGVILSNAATAEYCNGVVFCDYVSDGSDVKKNSGEESSSGEGVDEDEKGASPSKKNAVKNVLCVNNFADVDPKGDIFLEEFRRELNLRKEVDPDFEKQSAYAKLTLGDIELHHITGKSAPVTRKNAKDTFKSDALPTSRGKIRLVFNYQIYREGVDSVTANLVAFLKPVKSWTRFVQGVGRVARLIRLLSFGGESVNAERMPKMLDRSVVMLPPCGLVLDKKMIDAADEEIEADDKKGNSRAHMLLDKKISATLSGARYKAMLRHVGLLQYGMEPDHHSSINIKEQPDEPP
ncbi:unnamed protein product, partial [Amoebophrya sp. A25]